MTVPFPGESIGCGDGWSSDGYAWNLYKDVWWRGSATDDNSTPGHRVIAAGTEWRCWAYSWDRPYLEAADDATPLEVSWVIEVLDGSGMLTLSDFHDTDWDYVTTGALPNALGTVSIAGPGTYVVTTTSFSNTVLRQAGWEVGPPELRIECISGSVDIQQVKLRVWPVGGPLGYWSEEYSGDPGVSAAVTIRTALIGFVGGVPPDEDALHAASLAWHTPSIVSGPSGLVGSGGGTVFYQAPYSESFDYFISSPSGAFLRRNTSYMRVDPPGTEGVEWIRDPEEVQEDRTEHHVQYSAAPSVTWVDPAVTLVSQPGLTEVSDPPLYLTPQAGGSVQFRYSFVDALPAVNDEANSALGGGTPWVTDVDRGFESPELRYNVNLPEFPADKYLRVVAWHDQLYSNMPVSSFHGAGILNRKDGVSAAPQFHWQPAPYRYWDPAGTPPPPEGEPEFITGYFLDGDPNLDGLHDGVDVNFG